jgi:hypothetical protein
VSSKLSLNIGYVNVQGLNDHAFHCITHLIRSNTFDLIILSETWFLNRNLYSNSSFFLAESLIPTNHQHGRRYNGGLLALVSPHLKNCTNIFHTSKHSIGLSLDNQKFGFVYYPPSLTATHIEADLHALGQVHTLVGDINVRYGSLSGDKISNSADKKLVINQFTSLYNLGYLRNQNSEVVSRTDHVFSSLNLNWEYITNLNFKTDHGLMKIKLDSTASHTQLTSMKSHRFDFKALKNPVFRSFFTDRYDILYSQNMKSESLRSYDTLCHSCILPSTSSSQEIIDLTYTSLIQTIYSLLSSTLQEYDAHEVKSKPDYQISKATEPPTSVVSAIRNFKRSQRLKHSRNPIVSNDPSLTPLESASDHYGRLFNCQDPAPEITRGNDLVFATMLTEDKINKSIMSYPNHKSMGPDGIHTLAFKALAKSSIFISTLTDLFQSYAATGLVPSAWSQCNLHLLIKDDSNPIPQNTRPISLSNILRRIFEKLILRSWTDSGESWTKLNDGQAGFRRGYSTLSHLVLSDEISRRNCPFSIFLDIKAAFDTVSWLKLDDILKNRQCPDTQRSLILSLICRPAELYLSVNQSERRTIHTRKGVFQGGGISAFIFAVYIDPLAEQLNQDSPPHRPNALLYADDIQLKPRYASECQRLLDICTSFSLDLKLTWNLKKCAVVGDCPVPLLLSGQMIPTLESYKYLGAVHTSKGIDWHTTMSNSVAKQAKLLSVLNDTHWHPHLKLIIHRTFARPINEYTAALTWIWIKKSPKTRQSTLKIMQDAYNAGLCTIFGRLKHQKLMDYMSGYGSFIFRMECLHACLNRSFNQLTPCNPLLKARQVYHLSWSSNFILQSCFQSQYLKEYEKARSKEVITWKTWKRRKLDSLQAIDAKSYATVAYFNPRSRNSDYTSCAFNLPQTSFRIITDWRFNRFLNHRTCSCTQRFNRRHVACILSSSSMYAEIESQSSFMKAAKRLKLLQSAAPFYNPIDHCLNLQEFSLFLTLFDTLQTILDSQ